MRRSEEGFTFVEFLVVVIIVGILAAIAIPIYLGVQENYRKHQQSCIVDVTTQACVK